jgi:hypothetical protein
MLYVIVSSLPRLVHLRLAYHLRLATVGKYEHTIYIIKPSANGLSQENKGSLPVASICFISVTQRQLAVGHVQ